MNPQLEEFRRMYENNQHPWGEGLRAGEVARYEDTPPKTVLDIGGGDGRLALNLAEQGHRVVVIDGMDLAVDILEQEAEERGLSDLVDVHLLDLTEVDALDDLLATEYEGVQFDAVEAVNVFHYMPREDVRTVVNIVAKHMATDGELVVHDYRPEDEATQMETGYFTHDQLQEMFEAAGLVFDEDSYVQAEVKTLSGNVRPSHTAIGRAALISDADLHDTNF